VRIATFGRVEKCLVEVAVIFGFAVVQAGSGT